MVRTYVHTYVHVCTQLVLATAFENNCPKLGIFVLTLDSFVRILSGEGLLLQALACTSRTVLKSCYTIHIHVHTFKCNAGNEPVACSQHTVHMYVHVVFLCIQFRKLGSRQHTRTCSFEMTHATQGPEC